MALHSDSRNWKSVVLVVLIFGLILVFLSFGLPKSFLGGCGGGFMPDHGAAPAEDSEETAQEAAEEGTNPNPKENGGT